MPDLDRFQVFLLRRGNKQTTNRLHLRNLKSLLSFIPSFSLKEINKFILTCQKKEYKASYINKYIDVIRLYAQLKKAPLSLQKFSYLKEKEAIKATLSDEEIEAFLKLLPKRKGKKEGLNYNKWTLFFSLMAFTGMRSGEVASLKVDQVDFGRGIFVIEDSKTNTPRFVPIPPNIKTVLENYVKKCTGYLFPSPRNGKDGVVRNVDWGYQFHQRLNRLGIKRKYLTPYSLRHSFITRMLEEDVNIFKIQKIVGHRDLRTTAHYTHLTTKDIQRAITRHPIIRRSTEPITIIHSLVEMIKSFSIENDNRFFYRLEENNNGLRFELSLK